MTFKGNKGSGRQRRRSIIEVEQFGWAWRPTLTAQLHQRSRDNFTVLILHSIEIDQDRH